MNTTSIDGGCTCREVRYRLTACPMIVHGCHCRWCQRQTGSALAINALIETDRVALVRGAPREATLQSPSGTGQIVARCPTCGVTLWSHYSGLGRLVAFMRVGALDDPDAFPPDVHIYTSTKQPWLTLPPDRPAVPEFYRRSAVWPADSLARYEALKARASADPPA